MEFRNLRVDDVEQIHHPYCSGRLADAEQRAVDPPVDVHRQAWRLAWAHTLGQRRFGRCRPR